MTVQYIKDTIRKEIEPEKKEPANYDIFSLYSKAMGSMFMTPQLEEIFDNYVSEFNENN